MANFELRENSGSLFKNSRKTEAKHPDYQGEINVDGKVKKLSAWIKQGKNGSFMSIAVSEPYRKEGGGSRGSAPVISDTPDGLPF